MQSPFKSRIPFCTLILAGCLCLVSAQNSWADDCACETACQDCTPNACDCPADCPPFRKPNLIYKTLDAVAGGIEHVLGLNQVYCGPGCDDGCDGGCDAAIFHDASYADDPHDHRHGQSVRSSPHLHTPGGSGDLSPRHPHGGSARMRMGDPILVQPHPTHPDSLAPPVHPHEVHPQQGHPPQGHPPQGLTNPFMDDARVMKRRHVQPTSYDRAHPTRKSSQSQPGDSKLREPRHSRSYTPSPRLARTVR